MQMQNSIISQVLEQVIAEYILKSQQEQSLPKDNQDYVSPQVKHQIQNSTIFKSIVNKLKILDRLNPQSVKLSSQFQQSYQLMILNKIQGIVKNQYSYKQTEQNSSLIQTIQKLEKLSFKIDSEKGLLSDQITFKKQCLKQFKEKADNIIQDSQILKGRNQKLKQQLVKMKTLQCSSDQSEEEDSQQKQQLYPQPIQQSQQKNQNQLCLEQSLQNIEQQYLQVLQYYQCYDPHNPKQCTGFPKNKTQALTLLNRIQGKIQRLQMEKITGNCL